MSLGSLRTKLHMLGVDNNHCILLNMFHFCRTCHTILAKFCWRPTWWTYFDGHHCVTIRAYGIFRNLGYGYPFYPLKFFAYFFLPHFPMSHTQSSTWVIQLLEDISASHLATKRPAAPFHFLVDHICDRLWRRSCRSRSSHIWRRLDTWSKFS